MQSSRTACSDVWKLNTRYLHLVVLIWGLRGGVWAHVIVCVSLHASEGFWPSGLSGGVVEAAGLRCLPL